MGKQQQLSFAVAAPKRPRKMQRGNIIGNGLSQLGSMAGRGGWFQNAPQTGMYADPTQIPMQPGGGY